jgi:hypothetical protein
MFFCLPATHARAHFGLWFAHSDFNAVDLRKVHPRDAVQLHAKAKTQCPRASLPRRGWGMGSLSGSILGSMLRSCPSMRSSHV